MTTSEEILAFIFEQFDMKIAPDADIFKKVEIGGDDCFKFMEAFSKKFDVNMDGYLWYFHHEEEGLNFGAMFFPPPNKIVKRIPITAQMLTEYANQGKWSLKYPEHVLPKRRKDLIFNLFFSVLSMTLIAYILIQKYCR